MGATVRKKKKYSKFIWNLYENWKLTCKQDAVKPPTRATFAHVLDGKVENYKNVIPMEHGNDIFENVIPTQDGKHEKTSISYWK